MAPVLKKPDLGEVGTDRKIICLVGEVGTDINTIHVVGEVDTKRKITRL